MDDETDIEAARRWFAQDIKEVAPVVHNQRIVDAFASVPREQYLGDGPWGIHSRLGIGAIHQSATSSPLHVYHDVLISIDQASGINNGLPSLWGRVFDNLNIEPGDVVLQVGAGTGYYTAILAELVTSKGRVIAYEIEGNLAKQAKENLQHYAQVEVVSGDATEAKDLPQVDIVVACAGVTHVPLLWLDHLSDTGRMVLPVTGGNQWGFLMHLARDGDDFPIKSLGPCGFYHCAGARLDGEEQTLSEALKLSNGGAPRRGYYHLGQPDDQDGQVWVIGQSYWITHE
ncbi:MAG: protein-L-isoaspartate(D-aspartate) O-methyltransferase [Hyphomicrobiales bacterium]|nr:MAG: protein-L-isoaspartate(D-aspartate) O-methyltransferase [Hyphomicrobiales bacterium]